MIVNIFIVFQVPEVVSKIQAASPICQGSVTFISSRWQPDKKRWFKRTFQAKHSPLLYSTLYEGTSKSLNTNTILYNQSLVEKAKIDGVWTQLGGHNHKVKKWHNLFYVYCTLSQKQPSIQPKDEEDLRAVNPNEYRTNFTTKTLIVYVIN